MSYGFYLIHRSFWDDPLFKSEKFSEREAWHWMIAQASFKPHKVRYRNKILEVVRGQVPTSYRKLKEVFGWSNDRIKSFLALLEDDGKITKQTGTGFLVITICNYERLQDALRNTGTQTGTQTGTVTGTVTGTHIGANITKGKLKDNEISSYELIRREQKLTVPDKLEKAKPDVEEMVRQWNATLPNLPSVVRITDNRKKAVGLRWNNELKQSTEQWLTLLRKISDSDFLQGSNSTGFQANFDWVLKPANMTKILEGNYDNRRKSKPSGASTPGTGRHRDFEQQDWYAGTEGFDVA